LGEKIKREGEKRIWWGSERERRKWHGGGVCNFWKKTLLHKNTPNLYVKIRLAHSNLVERIWDWEHVYLLLKPIFQVKIKIKLHNSYHTQFKIINHFYNCLKLSILLINFHLLKENTIFSYLKFLISKVTFQDLSHKSYIKIWGLEPSYSKVTKFQYKINRVKRIFSINPS